MEECRIRDKQLEELDERIKQLFDGIEKSKRAELDIEEIKDKIVEYTNAVDTLKMEFRNLPARDKGIYKTKAKNYSTALRTYKNDLDWLIAKHTRDDLTDGRSDLAGPSGDDDKMKQGLEIQAQSEDSLGRSLAVVNETIKVGRDVTVKLAEQTEQLERMYDDLKDTQGTMARSAAILKRMARKTMTDKYVWCVVVMVVLAILGLILWKQIDPDATANLEVPDTLKKQDR